MEKPINVLGRLVVIDSGHLLVVKREDWTFLPGGHVEYNEAIKDTIRRECLEEFAEEVEVGDFVGIFEHSFDPGSGPYHELNFMFYGKMVNFCYPNLPESLEDGLEVLWIDLKELEKNNFLPKEIGKIILSNFKKDGKWWSSMDEKFLI
jgi:ADP-ribose pyrophosphatase YjhB (NUDIX family)